MAKFKTTMNADKFKKAINALSNDPLEGIEFHAFRGTKDADKEPTHYVGLYLGKSMEVDYNKDKGEYKGPATFKGTLRRSAKQPTKKLVLEYLTGQASQLKELGKECLKASKLRLTIVAMKAGEPEPEPTADELAEMEQADVDVTSAPPATATAAVAPPRPTTAPGAGAAPAAAPRPTPPRAEPVRSDWTEKPGTQELIDFRKLLAELMPQIQEVGTFDATIPRKIAELVKSAPTEPAQALRRLREIEIELKGIRDEKNNKDLLAVATDLKNAAAEAGLPSHPRLKDLEQAVLDALKKRDAKAAQKKLAELKTKIEKLEQEPENINKQGELKKQHKVVDVAKWATWHTTPTKHGFADEYTAKLFVREHPGMSKKTALELLTAADEISRSEATRITPKGFVGGNYIINPHCPNESRPENLSLEEAEAIQEYTGNGFEWLNKALWAEGDSKSDLHKNLQEAFKKAKPFPKPMRVMRGLDFKKEEDLARFLKPFQEALKTKKLVPILGYLSTGTTANPGKFDGNVLLRIIAKLALDVMPYTHWTNEKEMLLPHNTLVKVYTINEGPNHVWEVHVQQMLPREIKA